MTNEPVLCFVIFKLQVLPIIDLIFQIFYKFTSFLTPGIIYHYNLQDGLSSKPKVKHFYDIKVIIQYLIEL